ncbi:MAG: class I SAM-dependent methyltransferase [Planctomycetota bacterium]|nr:class I SAM-dependent methyltransferase [Planctomycetota bacterium]
MHEANRSHWDSASADWQRLRDQDQLWRECPQEPALAFREETLNLILEFIGELEGKRVCVIGSGDNYAAFALAGMGAVVTSTDISKQQLRVAISRAEELGLTIDFIRADAADLASVGDAEFDLVCSTNGFFVWIAEPGRVFSAVNAVLKPGGHYIFYDIHPFMRPWKNQTSPIEMEKPYFETGPFEHDGSTGRTYEFNWTLSDIVNPLLESGLVLRRIAEAPSQDSRFWQDHSYVPGTDDSLLDWKSNPRAGLPVWMTLAAEKPHDKSLQ